MDTQNEYQVDLGNLMAFDPFHHFTSIPSARSVVFFLTNLLFYIFMYMLVVLVMVLTRNLFLNLLSAVKF
jgi:hypothetical protein